MLTRRESLASYVTKDGSTICELMHPSLHGNALQSLAEATVPPGGRTLLHRHLQSEEIYHVTAGSGTMQLGEERFAISQGDTIAITPCVAHALQNTGQTPLVVLCCCTPPYSHLDTELLETAGSE